MASEDTRPAVILVEMDDHLARVMTAYLEYDGWEVVRISDPRDTAADLRAGLTGVSPALLILDLDDPPASLALAAIQVLTPSPILFLASNSFPPKGNPLPPDGDLLRKPFTMHALRERARRALGR